MLKLIGLTAPFGMDFLCAPALKNITIRSLPIETEMVRIATVPKADLQTPLQLGFCAYSRVKTCSQHCFSIKQAWKLITVNVTAVVVCINTVEVVKNLKSTSIMPFTVMEVFKHFAAIQRQNIIMILDLCCDRWVWLNYAQ